MTTAPQPASNSAAPSASQTPPPTAATPVAVPPMSILSFGGGVNSTAMLIGMYERGIPCDLILFADTGGEKPETYTHREEFSMWLVEHGYPAIVTVREERWTLEQECLDKHTLPSIVTGMRSCSDKFKMRPQKRYVAELPQAMETWKRGESITRYIGFDAGEPWRVREAESARYVNRFLLVEWGWAREECVAAIERHGLAVPVKSSCFFCSEMQENEIVNLQRDHPELASRAIAMEHNNTAMHSVKGLKRITSFEAILDFYDRQGVLPILNMPARIPCMCYDGE